jgi:glutathione S-transferase
VPYASLMRLITIPFSHFCEKARWGLEHAGVAFTEEGHLPLLHWRATFGAGARRTVPVLVSEEGVLRDSTDILRFADRRAVPERQLYPREVEAEVAALEDRFDERLGPHARRLAFHHALPHRPFMLAVGARCVPAWEMAAMRATFPVARAILRRGMRIDEPGAARSLARVEQIWGEADALLADGRPFLTGARFTAADLTFAALTAPLLFPPEHPQALPEAVAPAAYLALRDRLRSSRPGRFALRLYREHRRAG